MRTKAGRWPVQRLASRMLTLAALATIAGGALAWRTTTEAPREPDGKARKEATGRSFKSRTVVEATPSAGATAGFDSERVWSGYDDWEPAIAVDPSSSYVYQMTTRYSGPKACNGCPFPVIIFRASSDGGATWGPDKFLAVSKNPQNDPMIEVASNGTIYAAWLDDYSPGVKFLKSSNHGASWTTPIAFTANRKGTPNFSDRPVLAISADGKDVYLAMNASDSYVAASHDYGATWGPLRKTNNDTRYWFQTGGAVAPNGDVYFVTTDFTQDYTGDAFVSILRSTDGGNSWSTQRIDTSRELPNCPWAAGCYFGFLGSSAALAIDRSGTIMVAYSVSDVNDGPEHVYVRSSNNGTTWSARTLVSAAGTFNGNFPALAAGPTAGDFRLVFQDDRNGYTSAWNTWYRQTQNAGSTWSAAVRLSDLGSGAPYKSAAGYRFPYGDYFEVAVDRDGLNHFIWGEGISYTGPGGTWYTRGD